MPLQIPSIDDRRYRGPVTEALARVPIHNPEWTNFNKSDPGVTLIELFAFLTENLLYRANQIPERNRRKFLQLLGVPLQPSSSAIGLVAFTNDRAVGNHHAEWRH
jgi:predicted phage baseplate assembly protein